LGEEPVTRQASPQWLWWGATVLLGVDLVIDVIDAQPLKLATSVLLFAACLLAALVRPPRRGVVGGVIVACIGGAVLLLLFRVFGPGL
jgi:hypothetical protein